MGSVEKAAKKRAGPLPPVSKKKKLVTRPHADDRGPDSPVDLSDALTDALPDVQPPGRIKKMRAKDVDGYAWSGTAWTGPQFSRRHLH